MIYTNLVFDIGSSQEILTHQPLLGQIIFLNMLFWLKQLILQNVLV